MKERYVLMCYYNFNKYEGFTKYTLRLFDNFNELQDFLKKYSFVEKNQYIIFKETDIKKRSRYE